MPKKEFRNPGKGMRPVMGYNPKNYNANYGNINWHNKWCAMCGLWTDHTIGSCPQLQLKDKSNDPTPRTTTTTTAS